MSSAHDRVFNCRFPTSRKVANCANAVKALSGEAKASRGAAWLVLGRNPARPSRKGGKYLYNGER